MTSPRHALSGLSLMLISGLLYASDGASYHPAGELIDDGVDALGQQVPQVLPQQSDRAIVPPQQETADRTWVDQKHGAFRNRIQSWANSMDDWFGEPDPNDPASANIRILLDNTWNETDGYHFKPRVRGRLKLPTLENRFSVVFGDDSLDDQIRGAAQTEDLNPATNPDKHYDRGNTRDSNQSLALRWSKGLDKIGVDTDLDLGIRSGDDVYLRAKASKDWRIAEHTTTRVEQIYRYGIDSKNYLRSNFEIRHQQENKPFIANQLNFTYADDEKDKGVSWGNSLFREHSFFKGNRFNYGVAASGSEKKHHLNSYGPFVSWRQPFLRDWFFIQGDVNYANNKDDNRDHEFGTTLRLEAIF